MISSAAETVFYSGVHTQKSYLRSLKSRDDTKLSYFCMRVHVAVLCMRDFSFVEIRKSFPIGRIPR